MHLVFDFHIAIYLSFLSELLSALECQNFGIFIGFVNMCVCQENFFGRLCELECKNGGTIELSTQECQCAEGYEGQECENGWFQII